MTTPEALTALADRVEREEPNDLLNWDIMDEVKPDHRRTTAIPYTTSLDAAVSLVPEGWKPSDLCWDGDQCRFCLFHEGAWRHVFAVAKSEPMARTAAALRARAALSPTDEGTGSGR